MHQPCTSWRASHEPPKQPALSYWPASVGVHLVHWISRRTHHCAKHQRLIRLIKPVTPSRSLAVLCTIHGVPKPNALASNVSLDVYHSMCITRCVTVLCVSTLNCNWQYYPFQRSTDYRMAEGGMYKRHGSFVPPARPVASAWTMRDCMKLMEYRLHCMTS